MNILTSILVTPDKIRNLSELEWELLIRQARAAQLLGRLYYIFSDNELLQYINKKYLWHFKSAYKLSQKLLHNSLRELDELSRNLDEINIKPVFLKGAAYQAAELPCSNGRIMSDIDLLVAKNQLSLVQSHLLKYNWMSIPIDDYDEKYYRTWMHEIPPLRHITRLTTLDVHHNILPMTNKKVIDPRKLNYKLVSHEWCGELLTLDPIDTVVHSSVHLFTESEFSKGLRDLSDIDMLIRYFSKNDANFVDKLTLRSNELGLSSYTKLALRYTNLILHTPEAANKKPIENNTLYSKLSRILWDFCYINIFKPHHSSVNNPAMKVAKLILYWKGHLLRMPLKLLIPHLAIKTCMQMRDIFKKRESSKKGI